MGYTTEFTGSVDVTPPLNSHEIDYLTRFAQSRRRQRDRGPYVAEPGSDYGQGPAPDIQDDNQPPDGQPGLWCSWMPTADGAAIEWDGAEKFYDSAEWKVTETLTLPADLTSDDLDGLDVLYKGGIQNAFTS